MTFGVLGGSKPFPDPAHLKSTAWKVSTKRGGDAPFLPKEPRVIATKFCVEPRKP